MRERSDSPERALRKNWRFQLLWFGSTAATLGVEIADIAYPLLILALTGSPASAGLFGFVQAAALFAGSGPAGYLIDRIDRRKLLLAAEAGRAAATGSVAAAIAVQQLTLAHLLVVAAILGLGSAVGGPVRMLLIRSVVDPAQLTRALTQDEIREGATGLAGPPIGGALYALARALPFLACALAFLVSLSCALLVRVPLLEELPRGEKPRGEPAPRGEKPRGEKPRLLAGVQALLDDPLTRGALLIIAVFYCAATAISLIVVVRLQRAGTSPGLIGVALSGLAIGSLVGAPLVRWLHDRLPPGRLLLAVSMAMSLCLLVLAMTGRPGWIFVVLIAMTLLLPATRVLLDVLIFRRVPDPQRGRAIVATMTVLSIGPPLGTLAAGLLLQFTGPARSILVFAGLQLLVTAYARVRTPDRAIGADDLMA